MILSHTPIEGKVASAINLRAIILLSGSVRSTGFISAIGRSPLDLPIDAHRTLRALWSQAIADLSQAVGATSGEAGRLLVRILAGRDMPAPAMAMADEPMQLRLERDTSEFRGTGGVLRDACADYDDADFILMANAAQAPLEPLGALTAEMAATGGDVVLVSHDDGTPSGLMLVRCGCLRLVPDVGFVDMKEQALPLIARKHRVSVLHRAQPTGLPIRTLANYITALHWTHRRDDDHVRSAFAEDWFPRFAIIEDPAGVDPTAHVHDSVVLRGGRVERGATIVRSLVCPGGLVRRNATLVEQIITADSAR